MENVMIDDDGVDIQKETKELKRELVQAMKLLALFLGSMWLVFLINIAAFDGALNRFGVHPREALGLIGIITHPFLHVSLGHIVGNTVGFITLGTMVLVRSFRDFLVTFALAALVGGLGIWLIGGANTVHVGVSGVVFGYFGYLASIGLFRRKAGTIALSVITILAYGGMIYGVLPTAGSVSWEGHLFGMAGGVLSAYLLTKQDRRA
jgi:membrane associated rhomboid family serine protease